MSEIIISDWFFPLLEERSRYLVLCGGRGSGKSEFAARKIYYRCKKEGGHRFLILRKVRKTALQSVLEVMRRLLSETGTEYEYNKTHSIISFPGHNGKMNELLFDGLDEPEKIKSIKGITGEWVEEATEFTESEFLEVDLAFREPGPTYQQIILSFNPDEALAPWLKKRFFDQKDLRAKTNISTVDDNPIAFMRDEYKRQLSLISDETRKKIYLYGIWAALKGSVYEWDVVPSPPAVVDEIFYGGDFGYSVNPAAVVKVYRRADEFWLEEILYEKGLTNQDIGTKLQADKAFDPKRPTYWDSAEQKSIEELYRFGISSYPAVKGQGSVKIGIDYLKSKKIHILAGSINIIREAGRYQWREDKHGNPMPEPVKDEDHALDAVRYAIYTHCSQKAYIGFSKGSVY
jgi:phage terminase large subunit